MSVAYQYPAEDPVREDRLRRNRLSAKKCRQKRKQHVSSMEQKVNMLANENAALLRENERLCALLAQIQGNPQGSPSSVQLEADDEGRATKRSRYENRLTNSLDSSESAAGEFPSGYGDHCSVLNNCAPDDDYFCTSSSAPSSSTEGSTGPPREHDIIFLPQRCGDSDYSNSENGSGQSRGDEEHPGDEFIIPDSIINTMDIDLADIAVITDDLAPNDSLW